MKSKNFFIYKNNYLKSLFSQIIEVKNSYPKIYSSTNPIEWSELKIKYKNLFHLNGNLIGISHSKMKEE